MSTLQHFTATGETQETASLYSLGLLEPAEAIAFEEHCKACPVCAGDVRAFSEAGAQLALALPEASPSPSVRRELLKRTGGDAPDRPFVLMRSSEGAWADLPFPGISVRPMYTDPATGAITSLVKMQPGAVYPGHHHAGMEHCYVLEGDLVFSDHTLYAGDYEVAPETTDHSSVTTVHGCLLLIINNVHDQLLPV